MYGMYNGMYGRRYSRRKVCALMKRDQLFGRYGHFLTSKKKPFRCRESIDPRGKRNTWWGKYVLSWNDIIALNASKCVGLHVELL